MSRQNEVRVQEQTPENKTTGKEADSGRPNRKQRDHLHV
jgi:hypothetical protein